MNDQAREFDLAVLGATGYAGRLVAEYLAKNAPATMRWAIAGRSADKLTKARSALTPVAPGPDRPDIVVADTADQESLSELAQRTKVLRRPLLAAHA